MLMERFDQILKELPTLAAPGVSGSRIKELSNIACTDFDKEKKVRLLLRFILVVNQLLLRIN